MILDFEDACWCSNNDEWNCSLLEMLVLVKRHDQHTVLATPAKLLAWCNQHLPLFVEYFKARLASAQPRSMALTIRVAPTGVTNVTSAPPWTLTAKAAQDIVSRPLRLVLENDESDLRFISSTIPAFRRWRDNKWVETSMGGGSAMAKKITTTAADALERWRTFFMFDSDRLHPDELQPGWAPPAGDACQGHTFELACTKLPQGRWHRLKRRSIENYLPDSVLSSIDAPVTNILFGASVGTMAQFYNMKTGLSGDGVSPSDPNKTVRAGRSQSFWNRLSQADVGHLEKGFGKSVSEEFTNVPPNHPWPTAVVTETSTLADALQDAM